MSRFGDTRKLHCTQLSTTHSSDTVKLFHGKAKPSYVCGYHSTWLTSGKQGQIAFSKLTDERLPVVPEIDDPSWDASY